MLARMAQAPRTALVFGGTGQIGAAVLARLQATGWRVLALSRQPRPDGEGLSWLRGDFEAMPALPDAVDALVSCGPLDLFARWFARAPLAVARVVAFGSTSVHVKQDSSDPFERDLARRLREAEGSLFARAPGATLLRPTLVYGAGRDATLTRMVAIARRLGVLPLPSGARGLRQPVHVDDLANAALAALQVPDAGGHAYDLPGGETLDYRAMVERTLAASVPGTRVVALPMPLYRGAMGGLRLAGLARGLGDAVILRMREDLVFDDGAARRDLGYRPRAFDPGPPR